MIFISGGVRSGKSTFAQSLMEEFFAKKTAKIHALISSRTASIAAPKGVAVQTDKFSASLRKIYIATSVITDQEMQHRVDKHIADRAGLGYITIECERDVGRLVRASAAGGPIGDHAETAGGEARLASESAAGKGGNPPQLQSADICLLECLTNLVANEMFQPHGLTLSAHACIENITAHILAIDRSVQELIVVSNDIYGDDAIYTSLGTPASPAVEAYKKAIAHISAKLVAHSSRAYEVVYGVPILRAEASGFDGVLDGHLDGGAGNMMQTKGELCRV